MIGKFPSTSSLNHAFCYRYLLHDLIYSISIQKGRNTETPHRCKVNSNDKIRKKKQYTRSYSHDSSKER